MYGMSIPVISLSSLLVIYFLILRIAKLRFDYLTLIQSLIYAFSVTYVTLFYYFYDYTDDQALISNLLILLLPAFISLLNPKYIENKSILFSFLIMTTLGFFIFSVFTVIFTLVNVDLIDISGRLFINPYNFNKINSPVLGLYLIPFLLFYSFFSLEISNVKRHRLFLLGTLITYILCCTILQNRSGFIILLFLVPYYLFRFSSAYTAVLIFSLAISAIPLLQIEEFNSVFSHIVERFNKEGAESSRFELWYQGIYLLLENPFGGFYNNTIGHSTFHNAWLDIGRVGGVIPVIGLMVTNLYSIFIIFNTKFNVLIYLYFLILINLSVLYEPLYDASPWVFSILFGVILLTKNLLYAHKEYKCR